MLAEPIVGDDLFGGVFGFGEVSHPATGLFFVADDGGRKCDLVGL
jgi:hypothetical protein